jgi:hypothetical protein
MTDETPELDLTGATVPELYAALNSARYLAHLSERLKIDGPVTWLSTWERAAQEELKQR